MQNLRWMRLFGDTMFAIGAVAFVWFALKANADQRARIDERSADLA